MTSNSSAPPRDVSAEEIALFRCLLQPERVRTVDLEPMLTKPVHRAMWASMVRSLGNNGTPTAGEFWLRTSVDLHNRHCKGGHKVYDEDCEARRIHDAVFSAVHQQPRMRFDQSFDYWIDRLSYVRQCRALIDMAQSISERAWNYDMDGAMAVADAMRSIRKPVPVEFVLDI